jgi:hypothetical protein
MYTLNPTPWSDKGVTDRARDAIDIMISELQNLRRNPDKLENQLCAWFEVKR